MQSSNEIVKIVSDANGRQAVGELIEEYVEKEGLSYLEAVSRWMEENSIPETLYQKHIPGIIIDKLKSEVIQDRVLRPSVTITPGTLDFMDFL